MKYQVKLTRARNIKLNSQLRDLFSQAVLLFPLRALFRQNWFLHALTGNVGERNKT